MAPQVSFDGLRVLSLESRRAVEVEKLIRTYGGEPFVAPSMREVPLESNTVALEFAGRLLQGEFDLVVFFTGVGLRALLQIVETKYEREAFLEALRKVKIAARGPKPLAVMREVNLQAEVTAPEPNTWRELLAALDEKFGGELRGLRVAVQEYGASNVEFLEALKQRGAVVTQVPVYQWALPEDVGPLRESVQRIASGKVDVLLLMTAVQVVHLFQIARELGREDELRAGLAAIVVVSIGPTTTEELGRYGLKPDFEPSHPKMGFIVNEAAQHADRLLKEKTAARSL